MAASASIKPVTYFVLSILVATGVHCQVTFSRGWLSGGKRDPAIRDPDVQQSFLPYHLMGGGGLSGYPHTPGQIAAASRLLNAMKVSSHSGDIHDGPGSEEDDWKARLQQAFASGQLSFEDGSENRLGSGSVERLRMKPPLWAAFRRHMFPLSRVSILPNRKTRRSPSTHQDEASITLPADDDFEEERGSLHADSPRSKLNKEDAEKSALYFNKPTSSTFYTLQPSPFYPYLPGKFRLSSTNTSGNSGWTNRRLSLRSSNIAYSGRTEDLEADDEEPSNSTLSSATITGQYDEDEESKEKY